MTFTRKIFCGGRIEASIHPAHGETGYRFRGSLYEAGTIKTMESPSGQDIIIYKWSEERMIRGRAEDELVDANQAAAAGAFIVFTVYSVITVHGVARGGAIRKRCGLVAELYNNVSDHTL